MITIHTYDIKKYLDLLLAVIPKKENKLYRAPAGALLICDKDNSTITLVGTNGYSLVECIIQCEEITSPIPDIVLPLSALVDMKALLSDCKDYNIIEIEYYEGEVYCLSVSTQFKTVRSMILENKFPAYQRQMKKYSEVTTRTTNLIELIGLSPKLLCQFLSKVRAESIMIKFIDTKNPIFITSYDYPNMIYAIMPIDLEG